MLFFGVDLGNALDHNFPSRLTDGIPHSSSDLLYSLFLPFTWTNYSNSNSLLLSWTKLFQVQFLFPLLFGKKYSKSKFPLFFALPGLKILSPIPNLQKYPKSNFLSDSEKFRLFANTFHTLATGVKTVSTNASFGISVC